MEKVMTVQEIEALMQTHGVRPTANRIAVFRALSVADGPVSLMALETVLETIDKSGVFRALGVFKEHHLVHVIEDGSDCVKYELCHSHDHEHDDDAHAHFYCTRCGRTFCLEEVPTPVVTLPGGYEAHSTNFLIKGLCPHCSIQPQR